MEPLLQRSEMLYGAAGVLVTVIAGCAWRVRRAARRHRLAENRFWYEMADRAERERKGLLG